MRSPIGAYWVWFIFTFTNAGNVPLAFEKLGIAHQLLYSAISFQPRWPRAATAASFEVRPIAK